MGLIRKFTIATGTLLTLAGGGLGYTTYSAIESDAGFAAAKQCRDLRKEGKPCTAEGTNELIEAYEKVAGTGLSAAGAGLGTTLLTLGLAVGRRREKKLGI